MTLGLLVLESVSAMQIFTLATVLPTVAHALDGVALYGAALAVGSVAVFVTMPLTAPAIERFGFPRVLTLGTIVYVAGAALAACAPSMAIFVCGRAIGGLGSGFLASLGLGAIATSFPPERRARVIALLSAGWIVPGIVGPPYAAFATQVFGWRIALVLLVPVVLGARILVARNLVVAPRTKAAPVPLGATTALIAAIALMLASVRLPEFVSPIALVAGALAAVVTAARFAPPGTLRVARGTPAAIAGLFGATFAYFGADAIVTLAARDAMGRSLFIGGAILTASTLAWSLASLTQPALARRFALAPSRVAAIGAALVALGLAAAAVALVRDPRGALGLTLFITGWVVAGLGIGLTYPTLSHAAIDVAPAAAMRAASATVLAELLGATISQAFAGFFIGGRGIAGDLGAHIADAYVFFAVCAAFVPMLAARASGATPLSSWRRDAGAEPAIDAENLSRHPTRIVGDEVRGGSADIARFTDASERMHRNRCREHRIARPQ